MENCPVTLQVQYPQLSLTGYRELAAHVQQVPGVGARLLPPSTEAFAYEASQVGALELTVNNPQAGDRLAQILSHYGPWEQI
ncbi:MAG: hypothetical protein HC918_04140 [Oscillatoriales cyanobacterium SM2_1_8]|nr:hypothetical protein [Oscillatoriales cyanobacterium SM2_1_8]